MFEKLVESGTMRRGAGIRRKLLALSSLFIFFLFAGGVLASLFNNVLAMNEDLGDLERLATPVVTEIKPETKQERPVERVADAPRKNVLPTRENFVLRTEDAPVKVPKTVPTVPSALRSRPLGDFVLSDHDVDPATTGLGSQGRQTGTGFVDIGSTRGSGSITEVEAKKPSIPKPPKLEKKPEAPSYVGVVNGKAVFLEMPAYPETARRMRIKGQVKVQVLIDEEGTVLSAKVVDGPVLLRSPSVEAAKRSKFSPTFLNRKKIKVRGIIVYNFK